MAQDPREWLKQAAYDMDTAEYMHHVDILAKKQRGSGMNTGAVLDILSRFKKTLELEGIRVNDMILFGSYATGTFREGSDIDVVVVSEDFEGKRYWERIDILSNAIYRVFEPIEAIALTPDEWTMKTNPIVRSMENGVSITVS